MGGARGGSYAEAGWAPGEPVADPRTRTGKGVDTGVLRRGSSTGDARSLRAPKGRGDAVERSRARPSPRLVTGRPLWRALRACAGLLSASSRGGGCRLDPPPPSVSALCGEWWLDPACPPARDLCRAGSPGWIPPAALGARPASPGRRGLSPAALAPRLRPQGPRDRSPPRLPSPASSSGPGSRKTLRTDGPRATPRAG